MKKQKPIKKPKQEKKSVMQEIFSGTNIRNLLLEEKDDKTH